MQDIVQMLTVRIGNENLSETVACYQLDDLFHPRGIQFVEDVIKQQQRDGVPRAMQEVKLCQLQRYQIRFVLPLRAFPLDGKIAK